MNNKSQRAQLKNSAKNILEGNYTTIILLMLLESFLSSSISILSSFFIVPTNIATTIFYCFVTIFFGAIIGIFSIGLSYVFLKLCCKQKLYITDIFYGFMVQPSKSFTLSLFFSCLNFLTSIPLFFITITDDISNITLYLEQLGNYYLFYIICTILYSLVSIVFSQCYFLLIDFPEFSVKKIIIYSIKLMKHQFGKYLLLQISFIPMHLLAIGSLGIGYLFVNPYILTTYTLFYLHLVKEKSHL